MARDRAYTSGVVASLMTFLVVVIGMVNTNTQERVADYHTSFVAPAYKAIIKDGWSPLANLIENSDGSFGAMLPPLRGVLMPALDVWSKRANEIIPPSINRDFHLRFTKELGLLMVNSIQLEEALQRSDSTQIKACILNINLRATSITGEVSSFEDTLQNDFHIAVELPK